MDEENIFRKFVSVYTSYQMFRFVKLTNLYQITLKITGTLDFVHRPAFQKTRERDVSEIGSASVIR
jgi:hypothetical protein